VTSSAGTPTSAEHGRELARRAGAGAGVERRERLVEQQGVGAARERAGERDALALAAGQRRRARVGPGGEPEPPEERVGAGAALGPRGVAQAVGDVAPRAQVREQRVVLEDVADPPRVGAPVDAAGHVEPHGVAAAHPAGRRAHEPGDDPQHRRLARAGRPGQGQARPRRDGERDVEVDVADPRARLNPQRHARTGA
jgi:hypothetical protein